MEASLSLSWAFLLESNEDLSLGLLSNEDLAKGPWAVLFHDTTIMDVCLTQNLIISSLSFS